MPGAKPQLLSEEGMRIFANHKAVHAERSALHLSQQRWVPSPRNGQVGRQEFW
jgi:hypothetical protein